MLLTGSMKNCKYSILFVCLFVCFLVGLGFFMGLRNLWLPRNVCIRIENEPDSSAGVCGTMLQEFRRILHTVLLRSFQYLI